MADDEDARSEGSFQSADDDDDFDLPQDLGAGGASGAAGSSAQAAEGDALPPGLDDGEEEMERWNLRKDGNKDELEPIHQRLQNEREHVKVSKMLSYVLRHSAHKVDVRIRKDGYVRLREIMKLRNFKPYNLEELMAVVYFDEKERFTLVREFDGELLIRANQGHTMKVVESDLLLEQITDPTTVQECVHGTYLVHWPFIKRQGLSKVARNHIHMANGLPEDGKIRGMRSTAELFVYVDVPRAMEDGVIFYRSKNDVILTQGIDGWLPSKFFQKAVRIDYNTCDIEELEFEEGSEVPTWAAELAPSGPGEQGTYLIKNLEALISNCRKRMAEINELKALQDQGQELDEEELSKVDNHAQVYTELQSLEQRFRQHKGHRRETEAEKEMRSKEEAEAGTVVKRANRAVTPPWMRGEPGESVDKKATEKEKAEWAALGRRREGAPDKAPPKKDDPWDKIGNMRSSGTPAASSGVDRKPSFRTQRSDVSDGFGDDKGASWRFTGGNQSIRSNAEEKKDGPPRFFNSKTGVGTPSAQESSDGRPRFINSKTGAGTPGSSWRDRMAGKASSDNLDGERPDRPGYQRQPSIKEESAAPASSWRRPQALDGRAEDEVFDPPRRQPPSGRHADAQGETPSWRSRMANTETPSWRNR